MSPKKCVPTLSWEFQQLDGNAEIPDSLVEQCSRVCIDGFGLKAGDWADGNREKLSQSKLFGRLVGNGEKLYGIAYYSVPDARINNSHILWEDGICLVKSVQHKGCSWQAITKAASLFPDRQFNWVGCRTQNPAMLMRYSRFGRLFPFDELYNTSDGQTVMDFLLQHIAEVQTTHQQGKLNTVNGVCTELYRQGRLGDYSVKLNGAGFFEKQLQDWGFQRERGDAVILVSSLVQRI
jgi:hypothetical protein